MGNMMNVLGSERGFFAARQLEARELGISTRTLFTWFLFGV